MLVGAVRQPSRLGGYQAYQRDERRNQQRHAIWYDIAFVRATKYPILLDGSCPPQAIDPDNIEVSGWDMFLPKDGRPMSECHPMSKTKACQLLAMVIRDDKQVPSQSASGLA